jgi:hypothetical protein
MHIVLFLLTGVLFFQAVILKLNINPEIAKYFALFEIEEYNFG